MTSGPPRPQARDASDPSSQAPSHRGTITLEEGEILDQSAFDGEQRGLRVRAPGIAAAAEPGAFVHIQCDPGLPMRRPMSIMLADPGEGTVDFLYKVVGEGTRRLAARRPGERLSLLGPVGRPFRMHEDRARALLIGGGVGIPPVVFLAERLRRRPSFEPFAVLGSEVPFPFKARPSGVLVPGMPHGVIACMPLLEAWGIPNRLASLQGYPGCFEGYVTELARAWLQALEPANLAQVEIFCCGPNPMMHAAARLAEAFQLPCQVCLEEYMACAVGGCMGCTVRVHTAGGTVMQRVCVDGPVFDAASVVWERLPGCVPEGEP
ncbi:MAG: dihydroorotate dehydrogenase electron transfer subunit [Gammaproteobacteria bacterium]|nr:dihydroorotate dehydrogenase electron transfer subunit [Gammaproteobacteria bacterium]NIR82710.1 dihydroorotate dehydrogenase electron transfer subunit [Gammaproteobacteria bacterium]NIR89574.1 dihydroorotate dehydrogenase electron transfer subunit [Gammaproteobacteria bacterium]NIU03870.1 dihydroorotate dehydrogenase electron transfer subunit [Gammaproteobacteria bacterium]NIV51186.1 dihydroorotate dehydrogenase electron transfer subunit [Gammaproteobacteria bacterium]